MNGQLWGRRWRILVSRPATKDNPNEEEALNVSELHCTFEIHKKRGKGGFYAVCKIYNLTAATENKLIREGDRLIIEAGYDGTAEKMLLMQTEPYRRKQFRCSTEKYLTVGSYIRHEAKNQMWTIY